MEAILANITAVTGKLLSDILVADGWQVTGGRNVGPSGATAKLEKEDVDKPIMIALPRVLTERRVKDICKGAGITPERFEQLRLQCEGVPAQRR